MAMTQLAATYQITKEYVMIAAILSCPFGGHCLVALRNTSKKRLALSKLDRTHSKLLTVTISGCLKSSKMSIL